MPLGVSVIIPSYRRPEPLQQTLEDLGRQKLVPGEVMIVDQSPEPTFPEPEFTLANGLPVRVLRRPPGVVAARNFAAAAAHFDVIVFLDDDVKIEDPAFMETHLRKYEDPAIDGVCGQELLPPDFAVSPPHRSQFAHLYEEAEFFDRRSSEGRFVANLSTCNCSLRKSAFDKVGGFDERFTGNSYGDDTDLAMRMAGAGSRIYFEPAASVRHLKWQRGGLRLSDKTNVANAYDRHLSSWLTYYRHVPPQWRRWYLWHHILRRQLLIKANVWRLDRWPAILAGIASSRSAARRLLASGA